MCYLGSGYYVLNVAEVQASSFAAMKLVFLDTELFVLS